MIIADLQQRVVNLANGAQQFNEIEYRRSVKWPYFERFGKRLHREVWSWHNGDIPKGHHIHHLDDDTSNNQIENLAILSDADHKRHHQTGKTKVHKRHLAVCAQCGCEFMSSYARYCGARCGTKAWNLRRKSHEAA